MTAKTTGSPFQPRTQCTEVRSREPENQLETA